MRADPNINLISSIESYFVWVLNFSLQPPRTLWLQLFYLCLNYLRFKVYELTHSIMFESSINESMNQCPKHWEFVDQSTKVNCWLRQLDKFVSSNSQSSTTILVIVFLTKQERMVLWEDKTIRFFNVSILWLPTPISTRRKYFAAFHTIFWRGLLTESDVNIKNAILICGV